MSWNVQAGISWEFPCFITSRGNKARQEAQADIKVTIQSNFKPERKR